jgi:hypothetical protein
MFSGWFGSAPAAPEPLVYPECESPQTPADYEALAARKFQHFLDMVNSYVGWTRLEFLEPGHTDIELYDRALSDSSINCVKSVAVLPASPKVCIYYAHELYIRPGIPSNSDLFRGLSQTVLELCKCTDVDTLKQWDAEVEQIRTVESEFSSNPCCFPIVWLIEGLSPEINDNIQLVYSSYNAPPPVWKREFVAIRATKELEDGTCISYGASVNHKDFPTPTNYVRGCIIISGWHLRPVEGSISLLHSAPANEPSHSILSDTQEIPTLLAAPESFSWTPRAGSPLPSSTCTKRSPDRLWSPFATTSTSKSSDCILQAGGRQPRRNTKHTYPSSSSLLLYVDYHLHQ